MAEAAEEVMLQRIDELARSLGADFVGVADLTAAKHFIEAQGGAELGRYPRAVSLGIELMHSIVDQLPLRAHRAVAVSYRTHCYDVINARLEHLASRVGSLLQR